MSAKQVDVVSFDQLTQDDFLRWEQFRATRAEFATPFFACRFSKAVQAVRADVEVAVISDAAGIVGYFPFHRVKNYAVPVGRCFNDAHNIIAYRNLEIDWLWLLQQMNVKAFDFHAMVGEEVSSVGAENCQGSIRSFCADIGRDSKSFLSKLNKNHKTIRRQPQKTRKMEREIGPVTLEMDCNDPTLLKQTIQWKREQYRRTNILDLFTPNWTRQLLHELFSQSSISELPGNARGILSVLRAGDQVVAAHYGIVESGMLHYWFPTYDPAFSRYSPGTALFRAIIESATEHGIHCVDMGYGEQPYKLKQTDTTSEVLYGSISRSAFHRRWRHLESTAMSAIKKTPMKETIKRVWRTIQPEAGISKLR